MRYLGMEVQGHLILLDQLTQNLELIVQVMELLHPMFQVIVQDYILVEETKIQLLMLVHLVQAMVVLGITKVHHQQI